MSTTAPSESTTSTYGAPPAGLASAWTPTTRADACGTRQSAPGRGPGANRH
eukprot:CAMPEP_0198435788 /NCGR_PEP_ID=MMETSP1452-20131203/39615_1 /TAXON_ID=1181717 /ORGANISM="Synchroma pusillum, Strain CCMP3072" /LENGTH=50 /DNA_ID=CAMNT_0044156327 /DNA_START=43 /DNA_END=192 /DNA_ORIENTATION=+